MAERYGATFEDWCGRHETLTWEHKKDRDYYCRGPNPLGYRRLIEKFTTPSLGSISPNPGQATPAEPSLSNTQGSAGTNIQAERGGEA